MRSAFLSGAITLALFGVIGVGSQYRVGVADAESVMDAGAQLAALQADFDVETTGSIGLPTHVPRLALDDEQRGFIFLGVINLPDVADEDIAPPHLAERLPETVPLHEIPAMVTRKIPQVASYRFVKLDDRILIVAPESREVAAAIPRYRLVIR